MMNSTKCKIFNPLTFILKGTSLIEASAGTGKTYTLVMIYLRLLLGLRDDKSSTRTLSVKEILVVTFTDAATKELRIRIIESIRQLRLACLRKHTEDKLAADLLTQLSDTKVAVQKLILAERQMDDAAIFTIHSFCQRMLNRNDVEFGMLFQHTLLEDETRLRKKVSADFWRRHCYPLPVEVARMVQQYWDGPEKLLSELLPYLQGELPEVCNVHDKSETIIVRHERIISSIKNIKKKWQDESNCIIELIAASCSHKVYSRKNIIYWLETINKWANTQTIDYCVPKELEKFRSTILKENSISIPKQHGNFLFDEVEKFYQNKLSLRDLIFVIALEEISLALEHEKLLRSEMGYDDLLRYLDRALLVRKFGETLAKSIRTSYPVAMIDEFQDTDPIQYRIFRSLYGKQQDCTLLLIGDPKQAIYAFRGADIFTYMRARQEVNVHYTLDTNWRSSPGMINAVNKLFQCLPTPFIFHDIPFFPVAAANMNSSLRLVVHRKTQPAMHVWLQSSIVGVIDYRQLMARKCAKTISNLLNAASYGEAWLEKGQHKKQLQASDIVVLVRNGNEAALIRETLATIAIPALYISNNRDNVFKTHEARELLWMLQAVLTPEQDNTLRCAIATSLLGFDSSMIEYLNNDKKRWYQLVEEFSNYRKIWRNHGVLPMLRHIMLRYHIVESMLASSYGERRLTDLLHLGELLQEASAKIEHKHALVRWLALRIEEDPNTMVENYHRRLESDHHLVQIVTIHKSKGLEFPLVFLPFAADFRQQKRALFHDRQRYQVYLDLKSAPESLELADEERLAEDLRLLYVAVTRAIYHCCIGIAPIVRGKNKKNSTDSSSDLHLSAIGYLIQQSQAGDAVLLRSKLDTLVVRASGDIEICENNDLSLPKLVQNKIIKNTQNIVARIWNVPTWNYWKLTSYTGLQRNDTSVVIDLQPMLDIEGAVGENYLHDIRSLTRNNFPIGSFHGTFLHMLFESIDFSKPLNSQWLSLQLTKNGLEHFWLPIMQHWIEDVISTPLNKDMLSLRCLDYSSRKVSMQFYLSIDRNVNVSKIDTICKKYDSLSASCPPINFSLLHGILKGLIDLVFIWKGRYYLLDYKSNWLGAYSDDYTLSAIENSMAAQRYDLQYQLYTLALHRYLRHRLVNYDYQRDFGSVFYLFLRGINTAQPGHGIYHCRPKEALIDELDRIL